MLNADEEEALNMTWVSPMGEEVNLAIFLLDSRGKAQQEGYVEKTPKNY